MFQGRVSILDFNYLELILKESHKTNIFYNLFYPIGLYLYRYSLFLKNKSSGKKYYLLALLGILLKSSTGRIGGTLFMIFRLFIAETLFNKTIELKKYYKTLLCICIFGIFFYFFRLYREYIYAGVDKGQFIKNTINQFFYYAFDRGNSPNILVLTKIMKEYGINLRFLNGITILGIIFSKYNPEVIIKNTFYSDVTSGNLPPTIFGEAYMNFGFLGSFLFFICLGIILKMIYNKFLTTNNFFIKICYIELLPAAAIIFKGEIATMHNLSIILLLCFLFLFEFLAGLKTNHEKN
jgi:oligosaccharide repeat unit polymerase